MIASQVARLTNPLKFEMPKRVNSKRSRSVTTVPPTPALVGASVGEGVGSSEGEVEGNNEGDEDGVPVTVGSALKLGSLDTDGSLETEGS